MDSNDMMILGGAILAIVLGAVRAPKQIAYLALIIIAIWPCFNIGLKNSMSFVTVAVLSTILFAIYLGLRWAGDRFAPKSA